MRRTLTLLGVIAITASVIRAQASEPGDPRSTRDEGQAAGAVPTRFVIAAAGDIACENDPNGSAHRYAWRWVSAEGQPAFDDTSERAVRCVRATP
jgi:hypothetical protein